MRIQLAKEKRQLPVGKKVQWPGVLVFGNFPEGIMISEDARIRIRTWRVRWKYPRVGQIWSQIEKLVFLEIGDVPWRISMATTRRGTFMCMYTMHRHHHTNFWTHTCTSAQLHHMSTLASIHIFIRISRIQNLITRAIRIPGALDLSLDAHTPIRDNHEVHVYMCTMPRISLRTPQTWSSKASSNFWTYSALMRAPVRKLEDTAQSEEAAMNYTSRATTLWLIRRSPWMPHSRRRRAMASHHKVDSTPPHEER